MRWLIAPLAVMVCAAAGGPVATSPDAVDLAGYDVVILGEVHDNPGHHANQAQWVERLAPRAIVFEMLTPGLATVAERLGGDDPDLGRSLTWEQRGWPDFTMYAPIFAAAPDATIWGGDVARDDLVLAIREGAAHAMAGPAALFGLDIPLTRDEREMRESMMAESHCGALPPSALAGMVEAQRLRDAALAQAVVGALLVSGPPVAVITGNGHARTDWGMPVALRAAMPDLTVLSIGQFETDQTEAQPFDRFTISPPPERTDDPCDAFR